MTWHDPEDLRRRLARYFDTVPHLAFVCASTSIDHRRPALSFGLDIEVAGTDAEAWMAAAAEAERLLRRVARVLRVPALQHGENGPAPRERVIYVRDQTHPCWREWDEQRQWMREVAARFRGSP